MFPRSTRFMVGQPGYIGHRLHQSLGTDAKYRFINYVEWESAEHCKAAHGPEFIAKVSRPEWAFFTSIPALYDIVDERTTS